MTQINWQYQVNNRAGGYVVTNTDWNDFAGNFRSIVDQTTGSGTTDNVAMPIGVDLVNHKVFISDPTSATACPPEAANNTATAQFQVSSNAQDATIAITAAHDTEATSSTLLMRKADGTQASPALVDDNAVLGTIQFQGYDGNSWANGARIQALVNGTAANADMPTELVFQVTPDGSETLATALTISPNKTSTFSGPLTVGVNDTGHDVIFYGATADNSYFWWDESADAMIVGPASKVGIGDTTPLHTLEVHSDDDVTSFTGTTKGAVKICNSQYDANDFTCLDFGYSGSNNPLVRIGAKVTGAGTEMHLGTSNNFTNGITNTAIVINNVGAVAVAGALSKGSGTFDIAHPTKSAPWRLRHSFIEGPKADLIYRGTATIGGGGTVAVDLDTVSGLTAGTWEALNQDPWSMVTSSGNSVTWALSGKTLTITGPANAICQWMVIGERKDQTVIDWDATDSDGHLIPEYDSSIEDDNDAIGA